jgi:hypothetical protein
MTQPARTMESLFSRNHCMYRRAKRNDTLVMKIIQRTMIGCQGNAWRERGETRNEACGLGGGFLAISCYHFKHIHYFLPAAWFGGEATIFRWFVAGFAAVDGCGVPCAGLWTAGFAGVVRGGFRAEPEVGVPPAGTELGTVGTITPEPADTAGRSSPDDFPCCSGANGGRTSTGAAASSCFTGSVTASDSMGGDKYLTRSAGVSF